MITVNCSTGKTLPLSEIEKYPSKLKKHSILEIDRVEKSIREDGLCFPITVGRVDGHNYIIDGEATYLALKQLPPEEVPDIPVVLVKCNAETIKKMILISTSTNHCLTKYSLENFCEDKQLLKELAFNEGELFEFHDNSDLDVVFTEIMEKTKKYTEEIKGGLI